MRKNTLTRNNKVHKITTRISITSRMSSTDDYAVASSLYNEKDAKKDITDEHLGFIKYVLGNVSTLQTVLECDKALSNMLFDMVLKKIPREPVKSAVNNKRWGDDD